MTSTDWIIIAFLFLPVLGLLWILGGIGMLNCGRFLGTVEDWHEDCDMNVRGTMYNGRKTYYVLWIPVRTVGFYHSTTAFDL
jgi:hypothetical protein